MKALKYHLYLTDEEYSQIIRSLIELKNSLIKQGKFTDVVDETLIKFSKVKRKNLKISYN